MKLTFTHGRKLNDSLYGGQSFEMTDFAASVTFDVSDDIDVYEVHKETSVLLESLVQGRIDERIAHFQNGIPQKEFEAYMYNYVAGRDIDEETYHAMSPYQRDLIQIIKRAKKTQKRDVGKINKA